MIVELTSQSTRAEYDMAVARLKGAEANEAHRRRLQVIVVVTHVEQLPASARDFIVVRRPLLVVEQEEGIDAFVEDLAGQLREIANAIGGQHDEPRRLYEANEYRAAVISAMTLLESSLRQRLKKEFGADYVARPTMSQHLIERAAERQMIQGVDIDTIHHWMRVRNEAVHTSRQITKTEARDIVEGVYYVLGLK